jgi:hypothetical protein
VFKRLAGVIGGGYEKIFSLPSIAHGRIDVLYPNGLSVNSDSMYPSNDVRKIWTPRNRRNSF